MLGTERILFESEDKKTMLRIPFYHGTLWLSCSQMAELLASDVKTVRACVDEALREELEGLSAAESFEMTDPNGGTCVADHYDLDTVISVSYRLRSRRAAEFRRWANGILRQYAMQGYEAAREQQLNQPSLAQDAGQVLAVIERYATALDLLDDYDHQTMTRPKGRPTTYVLTYEECRGVIAAMRFGDESSLFGNEKDDSFKGSIGNIYQSFGGRELYPTLEEKAANLLYFVTKNHSFSDGNKRIAATMFLYFLDRNGALFHGRKKLIDDHTLVALTIMIAESKPEEKEMMISVIMNCLNRSAAL